MAHEHIKEFNAAIEEAAKRVGCNAPRIADDILRSAFPKTCSAALREGADKMVRTGAIAHIKNVLKGVDIDSGDFADISPGFEKFVRPLKSKSYYVSGLGEFVSISRLIKEPRLLDDARKHMRAKGDECIAEAGRLDRLYEAVLAAESALA